MHSWWHGKMIKEKMIESTHGTLMTNMIMTYVVVNINNVFVGRLILQTLDEKVVDNLWTYSLKVLFRIHFIHEYFECIVLLPPFASTPVKRFYSPNTFPETTGVVAVVYLAKEFYPSRTKKRLTQRRMVQWETRWLAHFLIFKTRHSSFHWLLFLVPFPPLHRNNFLLIPFHVFLECGDFQQD